MSMIDRQRIAVVKVLQGLCLLVMRADALAAGFEDNPR